MTRFYGASLPLACSAEHAPGFADRADLLGVEACVQAQVDRQLHGALGVFNRALQQLDLGIVSHALFDRGASRSTSAMPRLETFVIVSSCSLIWALRGRSDSHPRLTLITKPIDPSFSSTVAPGATVPTVNTSRPLSVPMFRKTLGVSDGGGSLLMT
jgi:hypothetical protein